MQQLRCAGIWVQTDSVDWNIFAEHEHLYDISFYTNKTFVSGSDEDIIQAIEARGRKVREFKRYPKDVFPAFNLLYVPAEGTEDPKPQHAYRSYLS